MPSRHGNLAQMPPLTPEGAALLEKAVDHISHLHVREDVDDPGWLQWAWRRVEQVAGGTLCSTSFCLAGWLCELSGATWISGSAWVKDDHNGPAEHAALRANRLLFGDPDPRLDGVGWYGDPEDNPLFRGGNNLDDLRALVAGWPRETL